MDGIIAVATTDNHTIVIKQDGNAWVWGKLFINNDFINIPIYNPIKILDDVIVFPPFSMFVAYYADTGANRLES